MLNVIKSMKSLLGGIFSRETLYTLSAFLNPLKGTTDTQSNDSELIISLTSIPSRINKIHITIESFLLQSQKPNRIILWLSEYNLEGEKVLDKNDLPYILRKQQKRGLEIRFCQEIRSFQKLVPTLELCPSATVVTADDDTLYPLNWLQTLYETHLRFPDTVICFRGVEMTFNNDGKLTPYHTWQEHRQGMSPSARLFPQGCGGVVYPPNIFNSTVFEKDTFLTLCPTADDVWFKAMSLLNNKMCVKIEDSHQDFSRLRGSQTDDQTLHFINNIQGKNDPQIDAVFSKYALIPKLKASK